MEQDEVGLDAQVAELLDALLEVAEVGGVGSLEVPAGLRRALEGIAGRLVRAVDERLGQDAHSDLVVRAVRQGLQRLLLQVVTLVGPGVGGGPQREEPGAVGVAEVEAVVHSDRTVVVRTRRITGEAARDPVQRAGVAQRPEGPVAFLVRHEPDPVHPVTVVEAVRGQRPLPEPEIGPQVDLGERVSVCRAVQFQLEHPPPPDRAALDEPGAAGRHVGGLVVGGRQHLQLGGRLLDRRLLHRRQLGVEGLAGDRVDPEGPHHGGHQLQASPQEGCPHRFVLDAGHVRADHGRGLRVAQYIGEDGSGAVGHLELLSLIGISGVGGGRPAWWDGRRKVLRGRPRSAARTR